MPKPTIPADPERLRELSEEASLVDEQLGQLASSLRVAEGTSQAALDLKKPPCPVIPLAKDNVRAPIVVRIHPHREALNDQLQELAERVVPLLEYLDLDDRDKQDIRKMLPIAQADSSPLPSLGAASRSLLFEDDGCGVVFPTSAKYDSETEKRNAVRVVRLQYLLDRLGEALERNRKRIQAKLNPPTVRDRVKLDHEKYIVTVDGKSYSVSENQATLFKYLIEANGNIVSGPEIAKRERLEEFKASRFLEQLESKYPDLARIVQVTERPRGYRIVLPPLD